MPASLPPGPGGGLAPEICTGRLPVRYRVPIVTVAAVIPVLAASLFRLPVTGRGPQPRFLERWRAPGTARPAQGGSTR